MVENGGEVGQRSLIKIANYLAIPPDVLRRLADGEDVGADELPPLPGRVNSPTEAELLAAVRELTEVVRALRADLRSGRR